MSKRRSVDGCAKAHSPRSVPEGFGHLLYSVYIYTRNPSTRPWSLLLGPWVRVVAQETRVLNTDPMSSTPATHPTSFHANPQILTKRLPPPPPQVLPRSRRLQPPSPLPPLHLSGMHPFQAPAPAPPLPAARRCPLVCLCASPLPMRRPGTVNERRSQRICFPWSDHEKRVPPRRARCSRTWR